MNRFLIIASLQRVFHMSLTEIKHLTPRAVQRYIAILEGEADAANEAKQKTGQR